MRILVIDDMAQNLASAMMTLKGHEVTTVDSIELAMKILEKDELPFDAVLTDLFLPRGNFRGCMNTSKYWVKPETLIPAGLVFALHTSNRGIRTVICTDGDHHNEWICTLLDLVGCGNEDTRWVSYVEARCACVEGIWKDGKIEMCEDWYTHGGPTIKDHLKAMHQSELFPELREAA